MGIIVYSGGDVHRSSIFKDTEFFIKWDGHWDLFLDEDLAAANAAIDAEIKDLIMKILWWKMVVCASYIEAEHVHHFRTPVKPAQNRGLSASDLQKLPKVTGKDLVMDTDCAICLDEIKPEQPARMVPGCNHDFHLECDDAWLTKNSICPVCRAKLNPDQISPC
ncbi:hypothetical protein SASPL_156896 [Salvia splendens]|uniref:RING-type domain-containing protein n=1 Tax=Salvia splendens TaxID=180675 RepID=A0A8X8YV74_SALSN|nr:E3 ubiquitin-protein ligase ATL23-like [Salvia splendens]KAG6383351.1 hypothetical protein SASPL_156896 [Salvia splendens]